MAKEKEIHTGRCLCGDVAYEVYGPLRPVVVCHCSQCRRTSGHFVAATQAFLDDLRVVADKGLRWFQSSAKANRGFCGRCGSSLFYRIHEQPRISIMAGTLDPPTGLRIAGHIHGESASDYYEIPRDETPLSEDELRALSLG